MPPLPVAIVPHTHWDREWYAPFQTFRVGLVRLLDQLLDLLERDEAYTRFLLDGQTVVVDDYLAVRPEAAERIAALAAAGRLQIGPWMVLMDEFMVSGETIIRDLQLGIRRASELGAVMEVGYLPDMFGHVAQMPQLLRLAGFEHAVVWRGVPAAIDCTAFWWTAPDGSRVRAEYLFGSYSNGRDLPLDVGGLVRRARGYVGELGPAHLDGGGVLLMNGTDHHLPQAGLGKVVAAANSEQDEYRFSITSLPEYLRQQPTPPDLPECEGELRSGARANVLMGVASNRVDVHRACARAERAIERRAEPLSALLVSPARYPGMLLAEAWRNLVLNSAHDSSCACSSDEVVDAVLVRYQEARQIGDALTREALHDLATRIDAPPGSTLVCNPTRRARGGLVQAVIPGEGPVHLVSHDGVACPTQIARYLGGEGFNAIVVGRKVRWVLELIRGHEFAGAQIAQVTRREVGANDFEYTFRAARPFEDLVDLEYLRDELLALGDGGATMRFRQTVAPALEVVFRADAVPGFGWRTYTAVEGAGPGTAVTAEVAADGAVVANEHLRVEVDREDGTFTVTTSDGVEVVGCNRLVDGGDGGDTYNYSPPTEDEIIDEPQFVRLDVLEHGPVRASILVTSLYQLPQHAIGDERMCSRRSDETARFDVRTTLELRSDERFLRVHVELENTCRDHRLRAHFPLPAPVEGSDAECAFAVVHRGLTVEGGPNEIGLPTFVSRRFVDCSSGAVGLALLHDGLLEYEVLTDDAGGGDELALTLLRSVGYLSRSELALRPNPAGPLDPLEGAQLEGRHVVDYAVLPHRGDWQAAALHGAADELLVPLERVRAGGVAGASTSPTGSALGVEGAEVSAVLRENGALVVRVANSSPVTTTARVELHGRIARGEVVDLRGRVVASFTGELQLRPWELATLRLEGPP
jgi:mannosylglycerate hydrolase